MELEQREAGLTGLREGSVSGGEDGEGRGLYSEGLGDELEGESHGDEARVGQDLCGVEDGVGGERGGEREEGEEKERDQKRGSH